MAERSGSRRLAPAELAARSRASPAGSSPTSRRSTSAAVRAACEPRAAPAPRAPARARLWRRRRAGRRCRRGRRSCCRSRGAPSAAELVERHLGSLVAREDVFVDAQRRAAGPAARSCTSRAACASSEPISLTAVQARTGSAAHRRALDRARGGRRGRGLGAVPVRRPTTRGVLNAVVELIVGQNARPALRRAARSSSRAAGSSAPSAPRSAATASLDWVALGFGSARGKVRMETLLAGEGADGEVTGAYAPPRPPAHRLRHHAGARGAEHDLRPRLPRHPRGPLDARSGAG